MMFDAFVHDAFKQHAMAEYPREACGFVVEIGGALSFAPCKNIAEKPEIDFEIAKAEYLHFATGCKILAVLHSHTNDVHHPTARDMKSQMASDLPWGIGVVSESATGERHCTDLFYFGDQVPMLPLIGRPFKHGVWDCYNSVRDYFRMLPTPILLPQYPRDNEWWKNGGNLYEEHFAEAGFVPIAEEDIREGDCYLMKIHSPVPCHAGVYLGDGLGLNHFDHHLSRREPLHPWRRKISRWLRYKG